MSAYRSSVRKSRISICNSSETDELSFMKLPCILRHMNMSLCIFPLRPILLSICMISGREQGCNFLRFAYSFSSIDWYFFIIISLFMKDTGGSCIIHVCGGVVGFLGALFCRKRSEKIKYTCCNKVQVLHSHSAPVSCNYVLFKSEKEPFCTKIV